MLQKWLKEHYGIIAEENLSIGQFEACRRGDQVFFLIRSVNEDIEELAERQTIALHLSNKGDKAVPLFYPTKNGEILSKWENENACVLVSTRLNRDTMHQTRMGRSLGKFHFRGRSLSYPIKKLSRLGQWKEIWEKRLDQMENVWNGKLFQQPENEFEKMFFESFPYYLGLTENAIQYLVDTELDDAPQAVDHGTVCHERFNARTWSVQGQYRNPFDWLLDHCSRDLAEWTRARYFQNTQTYEPELRKFFSDYQSVSPLSSFSYRLLYARLLFPLHYFECVESYYITHSEQTRNALEDQLKRILNHSSEYEKFLSHFYQLIGVPVRTRRIPEITWFRS